MSNHTITIQFYFPLEPLNQSIHFQARVALYKDFCLVYDFRTLDNPPGIDNFLSLESGFPRMILHPVEKEGRVVWVHKDSEKATLMSEIIGQAIEDALHRQFVEND